MNSTIESITAKIVKRSATRRRHYLDLMKKTMDRYPPKKRLSCGNLAHTFAACSTGDKNTIRLMEAANIGITTAFNDMLSAHQPFETYPNIIKEEARSLGCTAQVAGGVPAMCDGITQGQAGMELSLFSREVVAMATSVGLTHNVFDGNLFLGVCDKIVPGMLMGALQFGHLPSVFVPAGPMPSGVPNKEKARVRQQFVKGEITKDELLDVESASYHSAGTCTFYGTANTNQMMVELLGVQLPGSSFVAPNEPLREALTRVAVQRVAQLTEPSGNYRPLYEVVTEKSLVNSIVGLLATGGSTNHTMHIVAIAQAAGIEITWEDMDAISREVPLLARIYPNGQADVNHFQAAGGMSFLVRELRRGKLLHEDVVTIMGEGLEHYEQVPELNAQGGVTWTPVGDSKDTDVLSPISEPFDKEGGLKVLNGNLGKGVIKVSAVDKDKRFVEAPCIVFESQKELTRAFEAGELEKDFVAVVRFQGPAACGMPELHKMTPLLGVLQDKGFKVALVTDGRMSGASGKVPAAIHMSPEAKLGGPLAKIQTGDLVCFDPDNGLVNVRLSDDILAARTAAEFHARTPQLGRGLFSNFRSIVGVAQEGATVFDFDHS